MNRFGESLIADNLEIARNVYSEYANIGMLGHALLRNHSGFNTLAILQDFKLKDTDIEILENFILQIR